MIMTSNTQSPESNFESLKQFQIELNKKLLKYMNKSMLFIDGQFVEWFNLTIGMNSLIESGSVVNIREFNPFQTGGECLKGVFMISQPLKGLVLDILRDILQSSHFQYIVIITNVPPTSYSEADDYFEDIKNSCLEWMQNLNYSCDIFYEKFPFAFLPTNSTNLSNTLFFLNLLSSWSTTTSSTDSSNTCCNQLVSIETYQRLVKQEITELHTLANSGSTNTKDHFQAYYHNLAHHEQNELTSTSHAINEMLELLDAKDDCFSLGILSAIVANELNKSAASRQRRKNASQKVSLLLIDRNLDLSMISLFQDETVFDKINNLLPNMCKSSNDVQIDLKRFLFDNEHQSILNGNFFHHSNDACRNLIEQFMCSKPKECVLDVYRRLCEVLPVHHEEKKVLKVNADTLRNQIKSGYKLNKKSFFDSVDLLQIIIAYCQISDPKMTKLQEFDKLIGYVKILTQNMLDKEGPSVLSRLFALFSEEFEKNEKAALNYKPSDLIILLIYVYSLIGEECFYGVEEEQRIKILLMNELNSDMFQHDQRFKCDMEFFDKIQKNQNYSQFVDKFFQNLKWLKFFRKNLKQYNKLIQRKDENHPYVYKPLIKHVCENLIKTQQGGGNEQQPLLDIEYRTSNAGNEGLGASLFKSFGYLMNSNAASTKIHPLSNDLLIVYFVGGCTSYEMKIVKDMFKNENIQVLVGSSHFYNHCKLMRYLLA